MSIPCTPEIKFLREVDLGEISLKASQSSEEVEVTLGSFFEESSQAGDDVGGFIKLGRRCR